MAHETPITISGNLVADPELRFTPGGDAVAAFTVASTPRKYNGETQSWEDGDTLFLRGNVWRKAAENAAESLQKGMRVIVIGHLIQRTYENNDGEKRTILELDNCEIGASLQFATAKVEKNNAVQQAPEVKEAPKNSRTPARSRR
jgi:single-strand DNA-binding protein